MKLEEFIRHRNNHLTEATAVGDASRVLAIVTKGAEVVALKKYAKTLSEKFIADVLDNVGKAPIDWNYLDKEFVDNPNSQLDDEDVQTIVARVLMKYVVDEINKNALTMLDNKMKKFKFTPNVLNTQIK